MDKQALLKNFLPALLPQAIAWADGVAQQVFQQGRVLSASESADARLVGVSSPDEIRVIELDVFPVPEQTSLCLAAKSLGLLGEGTAGLTLGYAILVKRGHMSRSLLTHECRHVYQYEQTGSLAKFLSLYLSSLIENGYWECPFEQDARGHEIKKS